MTTATLTHAAAAPSSIASTAARYAVALVLLAPIVVNIFAFDYFLTPDSYGLAAVIVVLTAFLAWTQRAAYRPLFSRAPQPAL